MTPAGFIGEDFPGAISGGNKGITNYEEYSLIQEVPEDKKEESMGTLKKDRTLLLRDERKMEKLKAKLHTDDELNWLDHSRTFREQGVEESETLLLRRKFFYSDQNVDSRDPVQLNLLYVQFPSLPVCLFPLPLRVALILTQLNTSPPSQPGTHYGANVHIMLSTQRTHISFHNNSAPCLLALFSFYLSVVLSLTQSQIVAQITETIHIAVVLICHCVKRAK
ncbi:hypothetical protein CRENBAI_004653 [Crenichthys baileyi]|uniref:Uncharacterized protein n=1 Tax=Crenichthys baileyi TaxID=28760 RepID=A0AAV9RV54_9TELE